RRIPDVMIYNGLLDERLASRICVFRTERVASIDPLDAALRDGYEDGRRMRVPTALAPGLDGQLVCTDVSVWRRRQVHFPGRPNAVHVEWTVMAGNDPGRREALTRSSKCG